jgi:hypothetical protein
MHPEAQQILSPYLESGERLLWCGIPKQGFMIRSSDLTLIPFSLIWGGFAFYWEYTVLQKGVPLMFRLWGIPFVLTGLYMIVGRFFYDLWLRRGTYYGLTESRVLILSGVFVPTLRSIQCDGLSDIVLSAKENGKGTISFGKDRTVGRSRELAPRFEMIDDVRTVHSLILSQKERR